VFISYAREDRPKAELVAQALDREGLSVWWDRTIAPGKSYDEVIEHALNASKCVIVLWSSRSVASDWVKVEAAEGNERGALVPALIEEAKLPLEFRRLQTANLIGWEGDNTFPEFRRFLGAITVHVGQSGTRTTPSPPPGFEAARQQTRTSAEGTWRATLISTARLKRTLRINLSRDSHVVEWKVSGFSLHTITVNGMITLKRRPAFPGEQTFQFGIDDRMQMCSALITVHTKFGIPFDTVERFRLSIDEKVLYSEGVW